MASTKILRSNADLKFLRLASSLLIASLCIAACAQPAAPTPVIFDTDMYTDIDDALALAMLHSLHDRGEVKLLAVTISTDAPWIAPYIDLVDTFYRHPGIPIGIAHGGISSARFSSSAPYSPNGINYTQYLAERKSPSGALIYPHRLQQRSQAAEAVSLLRRTLAAQQDHTVVIIQVGYSSNLAKLLESQPDASSPLNGYDLVRQKVRLLSAMAGSFADCDVAGVHHPAGAPETNLLVDVPAAQTVFSRWPTDVVASGYEVGSQMRITQSDIDRYFSYAAHHPVADTYNYLAPYYRKASKHPEAPHDHATYDLTSVLYAARPSADYFSISAPGQITVLPNGGSTFQPSPTGHHRYLILTEAQKARALEAMVQLSSQPPATISRH